MDGTIVERVLGSWDAQEAGTLHEGYRTETWHLLQFGTRLERSVLLAVFNDVLGCSGVESADVHQ